MEILIVWLAIAALTAYFAKQKGRSAGAWFALGFLFSICLLYTSPSPRDQRGSRMPSSA